MELEERLYLKEEKKGRRYRKDDQYCPAEKELDRGDVYPFKIPGLHLFPLNEPIELWSYTERAPDTHTKKRARIEVITTTQTEDAKFTNWTTGYFKVVDDMRERGT